MRYTPTVTSNSDRFNAGVRPPLELIPDKLANLLRERDRIGVQRSEAEALVRQLSQPQHDTAAESADATAATAAARAGKAIPAPEAVRKLAEDRAVAARAYEGQVNAYTAITVEAAAMAEDDLYWSLSDARAKALAQSRVKVEKAAHALADTVEAVVREDAVAEWLRSGYYDRSPRTWPTEVLDLSRYGLTRQTTTLVNVRDVIVRAATTCLEEN